MAEPTVDLSLHDKLVDIQQHLKVPKDQKNSFADFLYRNLEDIEDKVKPFLKKHKLTLVFGDEIVEVGGRVYVKATATLSDGENTISNSAYAREAQTPKAKTDDAQLTGACSSYARKYAASGLFLIDNTKDADSHDNSQQPTEGNHAPEQLSELKKQLQVGLFQLGYEEPDTMTDWIREHLGKETVDTKSEAFELIDWLKKEQRKTE